MADKKYRIAILGTENSHAAAFVNLIQNDPDFSGLAITGIYGYDGQANEKLLQSGIAGENAADPHAFLGRVDGVIVTARHGTHHYEYGMPYIQAGLPVFIDKPITVTEEEMRSVAAAAQKSGAPLCGGSCLQFAPELLMLKQALDDPAKPWGEIKSANFSAPVKMQSPHGGFFFYSQHLVQMMTTLFGTDVKTVYAKEGPGSTVCAVCGYEGVNVTCNYGSNEYVAALYFENKLLFSPIKDVQLLYKHELHEFVTMMKTGKAPCTLQQLAAPVFILNAMARSMQSGREETVGTL